MRLFLVWLVNAVSLLLVAYLMPAISINSFTTALIVALVVGLFIFVINGLLFWWVGELIDGFTVQGFWAGVWGALVYSVISWGLAALFLRKKG